MGLLLNDFMEELRHPGVQAAIILAAAAATSWGCFFFSRTPEPAGRPEEPPIGAK